MRKNNPRAIYLAEELHKKGLLSDEEFEKARKDLIAEFKPVISSLVGEL